MTPEITPELPNQPVNEYWPEWPDWLTPEEVDSLKERAQELSDELETSFDYAKEAVISVHLAKKQATSPDPNEPARVISGGISVRIVENVERQSVEEYNESYRIWRNTACSPEEANRQAKTNIFAKKLIEEAGIDIELSEILDRTQRIVDEIGVNSNIALEVVIEEERAWQNRNQLGREQNSVIERAQSLVEKVGGSLEGAIKYVLKENKAWRNRTPADPNESIRIIPSGITFKLKDDDTYYTKEQYDMAQQIMQETGCNLREAFEIIKKNQ